MNNISRKNEKNTPCDDGGGKSPLRQRSSSTNDVLLKRNSSSDLAQAHLKIALKRSQSLRDLLAAEADDDDIMQVDLAHVFCVKTYTSPTHCGMCTGLLVGLWSQGLQCKMCGMNVHHGEGIDNHDDCKAEALLTPCCGGVSNSNSAAAMNSTDNNDKSSLRRTIKELHALSKTQPDFLAYLRAQVDRDVKSKVKHKILQVHVDDERTKKFARVKVRIVPFVEWLDDLELHHGRSRCILYLLRKVHLGLCLGSALIGFVAFAFAVVIRARATDGLFRSLHLALIHVSTVLVTIHCGILVLALAVRHVAKLARRKVLLLDRFVRDTWSMDPQQDLGVSLPGAASRALWWSETLLASAVVTWYVACCFWWATQPSMFDALQQKQQPGTMDTTANEKHQLTTASTTTIT